MTRYLFVLHSGPSACCCDFFSSYDAHTHIMNRLAGAKHSLWSRNHRASELPKKCQEKDSIQECEWLAAVYHSRRPQELGSYGWQKCDEVKDPESGRRKMEFGLKWGPRGEKPCGLGGEKSNTADQVAPCQVHTRWLLQALVPQPGDVGISLQ